MRNTSHYNVVQLNNKHVVESIPLKVSENNNNKLNFSIFVKVDFMADLLTEFMNTGSIVWY